MTTQQIIDLIFKDPNVKYELNEFDGFYKNIEEVFKIYPKTITSGKETGKTKYFIETLASFHSGKTEVQVYSDDGKSNPEEIVRQLWIYKLIKYFKYKREEIILESPVTFGSEGGTRFADILVYSKDKITPKILFEIKKPKRKDGIDQLKSYMESKGAPVAVWSNGSDRVILYRPYPKDYNDTLVEIPNKYQEPKDVLEQERTLVDLKKEFDFKKIILDLEELVLGSSGVNVFNEIFKIIFAKIWDEKEAEEHRKNKTVEFKKFIDPELTYERINSLYKKASNEWKGIFNENEDIKLRKDHLQVVVGPIVDKRFLGSNLRIMDDAFEYLLPTEAKKKKGQFFTPRYVIDMCVRMLNPKKDEYIIDPACGSAGFLIHAMDWVYPVKTTDEMELRKSRYASKYLYGIDFEEQASKTSRALMLIAGDGHSNIFGPDVDSLEPRTWFGTVSGQSLINQLRNSSLLKKNIPDNVKMDEDLAWEYFDELNFDVVLTNPPFAGEVRDKKELAQYELAKPALKRAKDKQAKEERDVLFIERIFKILKPGGRAAVILPQGKFNNSSLAFIREWILRKAKLLAVVGLHQNTFKPHTGTKTSVLFIQKYTEDELSNTKKIQEDIAKKCPDYEKIIKDIIDKFQDSFDIPEEEIPDNVFTLIQETFSQEESEEPEESENGDSGPEEESTNIEDIYEEKQEELNLLKSKLSQEKLKLMDLDSSIEALINTMKQEIEIAGENKESIKKIKEEYKLKEKELKEKIKTQKQQINKEIKSLNKTIPEFEYDLLSLTNKGRLKLILEDEDKIGILKNRFVDAKVAKKLDYSIFMAVSEKGGKDNSGDYVYKIDENGNMVEDKETGNRLIDQDLVNYDITQKDIEENITSISEDSICIAEAFIKYAKKHDFNF